MSHRYTVTEVCERLDIESDFIVSCMRAHWVIPADPASAELDDEDLARLEFIRELKQDFGVNDEAIPIILHLIDQLYFLRGSIRRHLAK